MDRDREARLHEAETKPHLTAQLRAFVAARFDRKRQLGLHLTVGLLTGIAALWVFSSVLDAVTDNATLVRWDIAADAWVHARETPGGLAFFALVSRVGSPASMIALAFIGGLVLAWQRRWTVLVAWTGAYVGGGIFEMIVKVVVHRARPIYVTAHQVLDPYSFPSGHATWSFIAVGMLMYVLGLYWHPARRWRVLSLVAGAAVIGLVGFSRVYLGVHYPSDVLGAWTAAAAWMGICAAALAIALHQGEIRPGVPETDRGPDRAED